MIFLLGNNTTLSVWPTSQELPLFPLFASCISLISKPYWIASKASPKYIHAPFTSPLPDARPHCFLPNCSGSLIGALGAGLVLLKKPEWLLKKMTISWCHWVWWKLSRELLTHLSIQSLPCLPHQHLLPLLVPWLSSCGCIFPFSKCTDFIPALGPLCLHFSFSEKPFAHIFAWCQISADWLLLRVPSLTILSEDPLPLVSITAPCCSIIITHVHPDVWGFICLLETTTRLSPIGIGTFYVVSTARSPVLSISRYSIIISYMSW